ncbi:MAG: sugar ABC transporter permease, partial [Chloroflexota bacterium]|nr:sugar ABC transporter permease [Chloroflexota bacterium]
VWDSLAVTLKFALLALPVGVVLPFAVALLLNSRYLRGSSLFRILFFLPYVIPFVAGAFVWEQMLNPETGWINLFLRTIGLSQTPNWLNDETWVYPGLVLIGIWGIGAGIVVYLAGLRAVPTELYDAARIDGAGWWGQLRHVTLPMLSPVIFYTLVLGIVEVLQYFLVPLVLTNGTGEPGGATLFYNLYLYQTFFTFQNMSYGATLAWLLFAITLVITLVLFWSARRWVYYAGER